eukprot:Nitzschia sp. Nitz4//scaffold163_size50693//16193//17696//NITZ4_006986-RA/size50693-snap-gene-0.68-mRNA-1//-1//CDS//3329538025//219//frame0
MLVQKQQLIFLVLTLFTGLGDHIVEAVRGSTSRGGLRQNNRQLKWGGAVDEFSTPVPKAAKKTAAPKETKVPKGNSKDADDGAIFSPDSGYVDEDCDDPEAPCASTASPTWAPTFAPTWAPTFAPTHYDTTGTSSPTYSSENSIQIELTPFNITYVLDRNLYSGDLDDGDYVELGDATDFHLTKYLTSYYKEEPAVFQEVTVSLQKTSNDLVARFFVFAYFEIPGSVPTVSNLAERVAEAFTGDNMLGYIEDLADMAEGNPFRYTVSVSVNDEPSIAAATSSDSGIGSKISSAFTGESRMYIYVAASGCVVLVGMGFMFSRQSRQQDEQTDRQLALEEAEQGSIATRKLGSQNHFGTPSDAQTYLESIREKYRDDDSSMSGRYSHQSAPMKDNGQALENLRAAMKSLESMAQSQPLETTSEDFVDEKQPFDESVIDSDEEEEDVQPMDDGHYMRYLDMDSTGSFDDEDLRS